MAAARADTQARPGTRSAGRAALTDAFLTQQTYDVRFEWGTVAVEMVTGDVVVVVDVLRFTTAVEAAVSRGVAVYPWRWRDESAGEFARSVDAHLADGEPGAASLSPGSLAALDPGSRVVLPSPNGGACAVTAAERGLSVVAACLRNAPAVASWLLQHGGSVTVIACGERWPDGSLRPSLEDLIGAGAVLAGLGGKPSPEARAAIAVWHDSEHRLEETLASCASGREQELRGWTDDLRYASQFDVSPVVPVLVDGAFQDGKTIGS